MDCVNHFSTFSKHTVHHALFYVNFLNLETKFKRLTVSAAFFLEKLKLWIFSFWLYVSMFQCFYSRTKTILRVDYNLLKRWLCNDVGVTRQSSWPQFPLTLILIFLQVRLKRKTRCTKDVRNALDCKYSKHPTPDPGFCTQQQNKLLQHKNITLPWFQTIRNLPFHYIHSFQKVEVKKDFFTKCQLP